MSSQVFLETIFSYLSMGLSPREYFVSSKPVHLSDKVLPVNMKEEFRLFEVVLENKSVILRVYFLFICQW